MKRFVIYRSRLWPQCFVTVVHAVDSSAAMRMAREMNVVAPIVGEIKERQK